MTIALKPETERAIEEAARRRGVTPDTVVEETMARELLPVPPPQDLDAEERERRRQEALARIESGYYAELLGPSSLTQDKAEERAREERRWK